MPRVSVVIPTYNCARFLGQTIDSALRQAYRDFEIIVVDDGSTDDTQQVVAGYGKTIRYVYQSNQGASAARNVALSIASGEFIAYLDADDLWIADKLSRQVEYMVAHPACGFLHTEVSVIDEQNKVLHTRFNYETNRPVPQGLCIRELLLRSHIQTLTVLERRTAFDDAGMFDLRLPVAQDYLHWLGVVLRGYEVGYLAEPLGQYRWRAGSLMSSQRRLVEDFVRIYEIIVAEYGLEQSQGAEVMELVQAQLYATQRQLAYLERREGSGAIARRRLSRLIRQRPFDLKLYLDFAKSYVSRQVAQRN
ncbi:MAG: glycosyltransferase [Nitrospira sp.]|jgi:glycosyltransferase involved in cell wall biosynthesis|nr:glycosyltransferase [Nitrospira sp.]